MTKLKPIFVMVVILIIVTLGIFVIYDIHDNLSSVMIQVKHDKKIVTEISVTMTKKDDKNLSSMTELTDKDGFVTFSYIPRGEYWLTFEISKYARCKVGLSVNKRIHSYSINYMPMNVNACRVE